MSKKHKIEAHMYTNYWKYPEDGFPQKIKYFTVAGPWVSEIQQYDIIFDEKDISDRFPPRNKKLLKDKGLL